MYHKDELSYEPDTPGVTCPNYNEHPMEETRYFVQARHEDPAARAMDIFEISGPWKTRVEAEDAILRLQPEWDDCYLVVVAKNVSVG
jgi:hypothetical protein